VRMMNEIIKFTEKSVPELKQCPPRSRT